MTKERVRKLYDAMIAAQRLHAALGQRDTSRLTDDERFEADLNYRKAGMAYGRAANEYEAAISEFMKTDAA